ncbi:hypothetical protein [Methanoculleus chikugoensis]|nr:hypothetical protein [Methanoculleus chikugoensis]
MAGRYLPPGRAGDRLMVYDLNKLGDDPSRGGGRSPFPEERTSRRSPCTR